MKHWKFRAAAIIVIIAALLTGTLGLVNSDDLNGGRSLPTAVSRIITAFTGTAPTEAPPEPTEPAETTAPTEAATAAPAASTAPEATEAAPEPTASLAPATSTDPGAEPTIDYETPPTAAPAGGTIIPVGGVNIAISGSDSAHNAPANRVDNVQPNQRIPKDFHVDNQGSADAYVFLSVTVPYVTIASQKADGTYLPAMAQPLYSFKANPGWTLVEDRVSGDRATYVYAYATGSGAGQMTVLGPGKSTGKLFDELVTLNYVEGTVDGTEKEVVAQAYAIQAQHLGEGNDTPDAIWKLVKNAEASKSALGN